MENSNININNFGIIKDADIDIAPLTVFIGPNSCGKSFAAKLIHCLSLTPDEDNFEMGLKYGRDSFSHFGNNKSDHFLDLIKEFNKYLKTNPTINSKPLKIPIEKINEIVDEEICVYLADVISEMITDQFDNELNDLINFNEDYFRIKIKENEIYKKSSEDLILNVNNIFNESDDDKEDKEIFIHIQTDDEYFKININSTFEDVSDFEIFYAIYQIILLNIFKNTLLENSFYIPAERSELIKDKKLLTRTIQNKSYVSKNQSEVLANIINIDPSEKSIFYNIACKLEQEFSDIQVDIDNTGLLNNISYKNTETHEDINSNLLSTSINELSIFILYLKYVLNENDLLIIEEPEAHLHPSNQRMLVKYFIKAINKGLKILITTHSDYIVSQLDNMINLNNLSEEKLQELNYTKEDILDFEHINIYNFKKNEDNTFSTEKLSINEDGFIEENFSKIANELYDETISIRNNC